MTYSKGGLVNEILRVKGLIMGYTCTLAPTTSVADEPFSPFIPTLPGKPWGPTRKTPQNCRKKMYSLVITNAVTRV